jgi:hypothetical protein
MPYEFYKIAHLIGIVLLFTGLVSLLTMKALNIELTPKAKKFAFITHGIGLLFLLVSGFGLMARLQMVREMPNWIYVKLGIWFYFGGIIALIKRKGHFGFKLFWPLLLVFAFAAYLGVTKPF